MDNVFNLNVAGGCEYTTTRRVRALKILELSAAKGFVKGEMDNVFNLNVGGCVYTTTRSTMTRYPDSMLAAMFSSELEPSVRDANGAYVMDRDGPIFRHVLNFLRQGKLILPEDFKEWELLASEADYYQMEALVEAVKEEKSRRDAPEDGKENLEFIDIHASLGVRYSYTGSRNTLLSIRPLIEFFRAYNYTTNFTKVEPDVKMTCTLAPPPAIQNITTTNDLGDASHVRIDVHVPGTASVTDLHEGFSNRKPAILHSLKILGFQMKTELYTFFPDNSDFKELRWTFSRRVEPGPKANIR
ncbi:BTB/POZ domain-containing protein KCTD4-like [Patiria miniata]|uniref:BTB domain-containing protein n=1 Tax=Patiria miniata TaxID=46514 RepID=A0A913ZJ51_PATMI|nr:BTB/POZ domain-containing protein KCTD4-like [Patiria miniata]